MTVAELEEGVQQVEGGGCGEGLQALEAFEGHLVAHHPRVHPALDVIQLGFVL